jgi:uncharacterized protein YuzE
MNKDFEMWWYNEGSQAPYTHHDYEEHTKRMCEIAWSNGFLKQKQGEPVAWIDVDEKGAVSGLRYWSEPENRHEVALYTKIQESIK